MDFSVSDELWFGALSDDDAEKAAAGSLAAAMSKLHGVRPFPVAAQQLLTLLQNKDFKVDEIVQTIESDPSLAVRVLRLVNAASFGLKQRCRNINIAVTLLGPRRIGEIATAAAVLGMFEDSPFLAQIHDDAVAVGAIARHLSTRCNLPSEEMYTCGLLHDFGKLMMLDTGDDRYKQLLAASREDWDTIHLKERQLFGYDHAVLAGHMLAVWRIPAPIPKIVAWHHQPARAYSAGGSTGKMVSALRFAERLGHEFRKLETVSDAWIETMRNDESATYLGLTTGDDFPALCRVLHKVYLESQQITEVDETLDTGATDDAAANAVVVVAPQAASAVHHAKCGVCDDLTTGDACPRCATPLCQRHAPRDAKLCDECEAEWAKTQSAALKKFRLDYVAGGIVIVLVTNLGIALATKDSNPALNQVAALSLFLCAGALVLVPVFARYRTWSLRARFVRTLPRFASESPAPKAS